MATPSVSCPANAERVRDILLALYRHPLTTEQIIRLNPTFAEPFPVQTIVRRYRSGTKVYREARTLTRLLQQLIRDGLIAKAEYALTGPGRRPYYLLTEAGFATLFPGQPIPKKAYRSRTTGERRSRTSTFFRPIPLNTQDHDYAVSQSVVHTLVQARRDGIRIDAYHTRNRVELKIPTQHALTTALKPMVRITADTGIPMKAHLSLFPDATVEFVTSAGHRFLRFDEIDGGSESVLSREDIDAIERKVRFYDHYQDICTRRFRVRFITYRPNSFGRLQSIIECARSVLRNSERPLFLFTTLERYLATNGALVRPVFLDHFGRTASCVRAESSATLGRLPTRARGPARAARPQPRRSALRADSSNLSTLAAAAS